MCQSWKLLRVTPAVKMLSCNNWKMILDLKYSINIFSVYFRLLILSLGVRVKWATDSHFNSVMWQVVWKLHTYPNNFTYFTVCWFFKSTWSFRPQYFVTEIHYCDFSTPITVWSMAFCRIRQAVCALNSKQSTTKSPKGHLKDRALDPMISSYLIMTSVLILNY